jgi:hypothetical protein
MGEGALQPYRHLRRSGKKMISSWASALAVGVTGTRLGRVLGACAPARVVAEGDLTDHRPDAKEDHRDYGV